MTKEELLFELCKEALSTKVSLKVSGEWTAEQYWGYWEALCERTESLFSVDTSEWRVKGCPSVEMPFHDPKEFVRYLYQEGIVKWCDSQLTPDTDASRREKVESIKAEYLDSIQRELNINLNE